jgi:hypothetical protein
MYLKFRVAKRKLLTGKDSNIQGVFYKQVRQNGLYEAILKTKTYVEKSEIEDAKEKLKVGGMEETEG